ncbi:hypothetical protein, partial [Photobacterium alginatilyticum]|uniref:hypothetical protein n=1 Tax=Photobacterium alginatilyticum TaxID=1775171 RepID=UPI001963CD6E
YYPYSGNLGSAYTPRYIHYGTINQQALSTGKKTPPSENQSFKSVSLAAGDGSLTDATLFYCYASTESTGSTVGFEGELIYGRSRNK